MLLIADKTIDPLFWVASNPLQRIISLELRIDLYPTYLLSQPPKAGNSNLYYFYLGPRLNFGFSENSQHKIDPFTYRCNFYWNRINVDPVYNCVNVWFREGLKVSVWVDLV